MTVIRQTFPLGTQWPTLDPFLFVAHHLDHYPVGNRFLGPAEPLVGREIGNDFAGVDGWNMYHGKNVPGFPQHPHRGFETVTYVRTGFCDHSDSLGATARFGRGDTQWMTAGKGIVHCEMFPLLDQQGDNPLELFQIWLNLPAADKMVDPYFTMLWSEDTPTLVHADDEGRLAEVTVIAGSIGDARAQQPPPNSWAARVDADVAIWHIRIEPGATWTIPAAAHVETNRVLYPFQGGAVLLGDERLDAGTGALVDATRPIELRAPVDGDGIEMMVLQGRPIAEPVAQYGPFVMNTDAEIRQAFADYRQTEFGGWPWPSDDPTHPADRGRFAVHADGRVERHDADPVPT